MITTLLATVLLAGPPATSSGLLQVYGSRDKPSARPDAEAAASAALRELVRRGLRPAEGDSKDIPAEERSRALATLGALQGPIEVACALKVLEGEGARPNFLTTDPQVRRAMFAAMAREPDVGQPRLVALAVRADDPVSQRAADALPRRLSPAATAELGRQLSTDRELFVNRAAGLAAAHAAVDLIPAMISAQYAPPKVQKGDEAWIVVGKSVHYVQNAIPVVGGASTSFQPVIGTVFEGSLLRVMESKVEIFRTEVHDSLAMVIEETTGQPAPPFGYDRDRWAAWYRDEFPRLAAAHRAELEQRQHERDTVTKSSTRDG